MPCQNHDCPFHELHIANSVTSHTEMQCLITDAVKQVTFPAQAVLFNKGESSGSLYALESGAAKICCTSSDGREQIVGISSPGSLLVGLQSINDDCYEYSAVAATPLTACKISHRALLKKAANDAHISLRLIAALNAQLTHSRALMRVMGQKNAAGKIASFILLMVPRSRRRRSARVALPLSRMEISNLIGLSEETVCRQMARMKRNNIIHAPRGRIEVLDWKQLRAVADGGVLH